MQIFSIGNATVLHDLWLVECLDVKPGRQGGGPTLSSMWTFHCGEGGCLYPHVDHGSTVFIIFLTKVALSVA